MSQEEHLDALRDIQAQLAAIPAERARLIKQARLAGVSWHVIGESIGMSHVGAIKASRR